MPKRVCLRDLTTEEQDTLKRLASSRSEAIRLVQRARIIELMVNDPALTATEAGLRAGFQHFPCGFDFDGSGEILQELPEWGTITRRVPPGPIQHLYGFIAGLGPRTADDLLDLVTAWPPEVIVRDPLEFGGYNSLLSAL